MYAIQHLHFYDNPVADAIRSIVRFVGDFFMAMQKARAVIAIASLDPNNQEAIRKVMLED